MFVVIIIIVAIVVIALITIVNTLNSSSPVDGSSDITAHVSKSREGYAIVNVSEFYRKYAIGGVIGKDKDLHHYIQGLIFKGIKTAEVPTSKIAELDCMLNQHIDQENTFNECVGFNNTGIVLEKEGKIDEAIEIYERCLDKAPVMCHPYDRLMILYRKRKDYDNEIRVIDLALEVLGARWSQLIEKYTTRREKAMLLKQKSINH